MQILQADVVREEVDTGILRLLLLLLVHVGVEFFLALSVFHRQIYALVILSEQNIVVLVDIVVLQCLIERLRVAGVI